jgi:hypothetical protein
MSLSSKCGDPVLAYILSIVQNGMKLIQIIVPIAMIIMLAVGFFKMTMDPEGKSFGWKNIRVIIFSGAVIFFIPMVINITFDIIGKAFDVNFSIVNCWNAARNANVESGLDK